jgi:hypothetical protein
MTNTAAAARFLILNGQEDLAGRLLDSADELGRLFAGDLFEEELAAARRWAS